MNFIHEKFKVKRRGILGLLSGIAVFAVIAYNGQAASSYVSSVSAMPANTQTGQNTSITVTFTLSQSANAVSFFFLPENPQDVSQTGKQFGLSSANIAIQGVTGSLSTGGAGSHHKVFTPTTPPMAAATYTATFSTVTNPTDAGNYKVAMTGPGESGQTSSTVSTTFAISSTGNQPPGGSPPGGNQPNGPGGGNPDEFTPGEPPPPGEFQNGELPPGFFPGPGGGPGGPMGCQEGDTPLIEGQVYLPDGTTPYTGEDQVFLMVELKVSEAEGQAEGPGGPGGPGGDMGPTGPGAFRWMNSPVNTDGQFQICDSTLTSGSVGVNLRIEGPSEYGAPDAEDVTLTVGSTVTHDFTLVNLTKTVSGSVTYSDTGAAVSGAEISAFSIGGKGGNFSRTTLDANGDYEMKLSAGTWEIRVQAPPFNPQSGSVTSIDWVYEENGPPQQITFADDESVETETKDFQVTRTDASVTGRILNPNGTPVQNGFLNIMPEGSFGMGNGTMIDSNGRFTASLVGGKKYRLDMFSNNPQLTLPETTFFIKQNEDLTLADVTLKQKTERVQGQVVDADGNGVSGIRIHFFGGPGSGFAQAQSDDDGNFDTYLPRPGKWDFKAETFNTSYVDSGMPVPFTLSANETLTLPDIVLQEANATVTMTLIDTSGALQDEVRTFAGAFPLDQGLPWGGAEVNNGRATFNLVAGEYRFQPFFDFGQPWSVLEAPEVDVPEGESSVEVTIVEPNVTVNGRIVDDDGNPITGLFAMALFFRGNTGKEAHVNTGDGRFTAQLYAPEADTPFQVNAHVDPFAKAASKYISSGDTELLLSPGDTTTFNLVLHKADATITGTLRDPDGNAVPHEFVKLDNKKFEDEKGPQTGGGPRDFFDGILTDENGEFTAQVVSNTEYTVGTGRPPGTDYMPTEVDGVSVARNQEVNVDLTFRQAAGVITGEATLPDGSVPTEGKAVTSCADGAFATAELDENGAYRLPVTENTVCEVRIEALDADDVYYESTTEAIPLGSAPDETFDAELIEQFELPSAVTTSADVTQDSVVELSDGTQVSFPALSLGTDGTATITVNPVIGLPRTKEMQAASYGVDITVTLNEAEVTSLSDNVTITFPIDEERAAARGIATEDLEGKFLSDSEAWDAVASVSNDTTAGTVSIVTDHLSTYAPTGTVTGTSSGVDTGDDETGDGGGGGNILDNAADNDIIITGRTSAGPNVRIVNEEGGQVGSFNAYAPALRGTWKAMGGDIDGDGIREVVTAAGTGFGPHIRAYEVDGTLMDDYFAYERAFRGGVNLAIGDVNGDGRDDVITAPSVGVGNVQVYSYDPTEEEFTRLVWKLAYDSGYKGGVNIAVADLDGDLSYEVLTIPAMGSSNLRAYSYDAEEEALVLDNWTMVYGTAFKGGSNIAAGDVNGDGSAEVVVAPYWGSPNVRVLSYTADDGFETMAWAFAFDSGYKRGVQVAVGDVNGDGNGDVVVAPQDGSSNVRAYNVDTDELTLIDWEMTHGTGFTGGVSLIATDVDNDGSAEVVAAPRSGKPNVRVYSYNADEETFELDGWFWGLPQGFTGGVNLGY